MIKEQHKHIQVYLYIDVVVQQPSTERGIEGYTMFYWLFGIS